MNFFKALKKYKFKTFLIFLSSTVAICSIFLITAISSGIVEMYVSMLKTDGDIIITQKGVADTFFSDVDLKLSDEIQKIAGVKSVQGVIVGAGAIDIVPIAGIYGCSKNRFENYKLINGNYPKENEVILGKNINEILENPKTIKLFDEDFNVSGTYESEIGFENGGVIINIENSQKLFKKSASFLLVSVDNIELNDKIVEQISKLSSKIEPKSTKEFVDSYNQFKIIKISSFAISSISFFMGFLAIMSIFSIVINERKYEFGIKRAIGISRVKIIASLVAEAMFISSLSFSFAIVISYVILEVLKNIEKFQGYLSGEIDLILAIYIFLGSLFMSILGAIIPAIFASKTDPIVLIQRGA